MAPLSKEGGSHVRRKSMNLFSRASLSNLTQINTEVTSGIPPEQDKKERRKSGRRASIFGLGGASTNSDLALDGPPSPTNEGANSPKARPRTLQKGRPASSIFGSLGRKSMTNVEVEETDLAGTPESPMDDRGPYIPSTKTVLYHGEIQTTSGMFRKKKEYLVLTDTHLIRFKSQSRASETFPSILSSIGGRSASTRHPSSTSIGSLQEIQSTHSHASSEYENRISLAQIVTVYKVEDGRPFFTTEVVFLDEECHGVGSIQLMLHDPKEADLWHTSIRGAAEKARLLMAEPYPTRVITYLVSALEGVDDYDAKHFKVFRVVRRTSASKGGKSSSDDLQKIGSSVYYMVIGINRVHFIPVPDYGSSSGRLMPPKTSRSIYGILALIDLRFSSDDDRFEVAFRNPMQPADNIDLAASVASEILISIMRAWQYLKPLWDDHNFNFFGPRRLFVMGESVVQANEDLSCFDRTLVAYCMAYKCNPTNIQYAVDWDIEDAPEFRLYPPCYAKKYTACELLAVMRALRYNDTFRSMSFRDIDLHALHGTRDQYGNENAALATRSGILLHKYFSLRPQDGTVLYQEIQALALKSNRLRRMDFTNTLPRRHPADNFDIEGSEMEKDPGCEIVEALMPLCQNQLTHVNWINISGIELGETDLEYLIPALSKPVSKFRAIECSRCGLTDRGIMQLVTHLERQNSTIERINFSGNPGRISREQFQASMGRFTHIRSLDLSRTSWTTGDQPIFLPEVMMTWKLEELFLNGVIINEQTVHSISSYLTSDMSNNLRVLQMDQCSLSGDNVAMMMHAMTRDGEVRDLDFHVSANRLEKGVGEIVKAIDANHTPTSLVMRMIEFTKEDYFRELLQALRTNTSIRRLDISKASLPYDAGKETCECLRSVFVDNQTLEDFDISGEQAHLEVTRFGIGLNYALTGLMNNRTLKTLRIEYQNLGLEGANTLSTVIEQNEGLTHIFCEHNDINLQGFTTLVNAVAKNYTLLVLPFLQDDQNTSMRRMNDNMRDSRMAALANKQEYMKSTIRRTLHSFGVHKTTKPAVTSQDVDAVVRVLNERWEREMNRLAIFLERNNNIALGIPVDGEAEDLRPTTALSDNEILEQVLSNTTPRIEIHNPVDENMGKLKNGGAEDTKLNGAGGDTDTNAAAGLPELKGMGNEKLFENEEEKGMFLMES